MKPWLWIIMVVAIAIFFGSPAFALLEVIFDFLAWVTQIIPWFFELVAKVFRFLKNILDFFGMGRGIKK
jgi:hypothetical protein